MPEMLQPIQSDAGFAPLAPEPTQAERMLLDCVTRSIYDAREIEYLCKREGVSAHDFQDALGGMYAKHVGAETQGTKRVMRFLAHIHRGIPNLTDTVSAYNIEGADERAAEVGHGGQYPNTELSATLAGSYRAKKYGQIVSFTREQWLADGMHLFLASGKRLALAAWRREEYELSSLCFDATGPGDAFNNTSVLTLSVANLKTAIQELIEAAVDGNGEPFAIDPTRLFLMVGPQNMITAMEIIKSLSLDYTVDGSGSGAGVPVANPAGNALKDLNIRLLVNPYIPILAPTKKATWGIFTDPAQLPAIELGLLQGHETPEVWRRKTNAVSVGGGSLGDFAGSFEDDTIAYRCRYAFGCCTVDSRACWGSTGAGS